MLIDLNADLGEGGAFDRELLALVSSANISCGAHAGDHSTITNAVSLAAKHQVRIGAHPSYPDRENFGRSAMQLPTEVLRQHMLQQLRYLQDLAAEHCAELAHIKPHGALYNQLAQDRELSKAFVEIVQEFNPQLPVVGLAGGVFLTIAQKGGLTTISEVFADRRYHNDGSLLARSEAEAVIEDANEAIAQSLEVIRTGHIVSIEGHRIPVRADTLCVHGDSKIALSFAKNLHQCLQQEGVKIAACATKC